MISDLTYELKNRIEPENLISRYIADDARTGDELHNRGYDMKTKVTAESTQYKKRRAIVAQVVLIIPTDLMPIWAENMLIRLSVLALKKWPAATWEPAT